MPITIKLPNGRTRIVPDDATQAEIDAIVAAESDTSDQGPPESSVMDERGIVDKAVDWLPSVGGALGGLLGGTRRTPMGMALSGIGASGGEAARQTIRSLQGRHEDVPDTAGDQLKRIATVGGMNATQEGLGRGVITGLRKLAPIFMRGALGAQTDVRKQFDDVDLDAVALRERVRVPKDEGRIRNLAEQGAESLRTNLRHVDIASGNAPVASHADAVSALRELVPDARMAARSGQTGPIEAVKDASTKLRPLRRRPLNAEETFVGKKQWQKEAAGAYAAKPGARGTADTETASAVARGLNDRLKTAVPQYADDVQRQQELIALERALFNAKPRTSRLTDAIGVAAGIGTGTLAGATVDPITGMAVGGATMLANRALTSPGALSRYSLAADSLKNVMQGPGARIPDALVRQMLLQLLAQDEPQD